MPRIFSWAVVVGLCGFLSAACQCDDVTVQCPPELQCTGDQDCQGGLPCIKGCCGGAPECTEDGQCNQAAGECCREYKCTTDCGQTCDHVCARDSDCESLGVCMACVNKCCESYACESDADCPPEDGNPRYCAPFDPDVGCRRCDYVRCETDEQCMDPDFVLYVECTDPDFLPKCRQGQCVCAHPCGAPCQEPLYCCKKTRTCDPLPDPCPGTTCPRCEQLNQNPGGTLDDDECVITGADCHCEPMPPLPDAFAGQHSALALDPSGVPAISGYFGQPYGDLIFGKADSDQPGASVSWEFVDGVPADAACVGAADGPRGGVAEPGDDVGWDTDLLMDSAGHARISYFDRTNGDLKYAAQQPDGNWLVHAVDSDGETGRFSSMIMDASGRPVIAYMQLRRQLVSAIRLARATTPAPASAADWILYSGDEVAVACRPADCAAGEGCLADAGICVVPEDPANCREGAGCGQDQACWSGGCHDLAAESSLEDLPPGVGLFCQLGLMADGSLAVAYYDSLRGNLKYAIWDAATQQFGAPVILAGEDGGGNDTGNLGADLAMVLRLPDEMVFLVYQDAARGDLYFMTFPARNPAARIIELVDVGARDANGDPTDPGSAAGELHWVGNFASLAVDSSGVTRVVYQDGTTLDLVYAERSQPGLWGTEILVRRLYENLFVGAYGFFAKIVMDAAGDMAHISNFRHNLRTDPWSSRIDLRVR